VFFLCVILFSGSVLRFIYIHVFKDKKCLIWTARDRTITNNHKKLTGKYIWAYMTTNQSHKNNNLNHTDGNGAMATGRRGGYGYHDSIPIIKIHLQIQWVYNFWPIPIPRVTGIFLYPYPYPFFYCSIYQLNIFYKKNLKITPTEWWYYQNIQY